MKDIHSHILFDIDDGAYNIEESIEIIKQAINNKYTDIVLTPHYRKKQNFTANNKIKLELFNKLVDKVKKENLKINIYLGNEITVNEDLIYNLNTKQVLTINNSRYLLLELPFKGKRKYLDELLDELIENGYMIIIVHPERYKDYYIKDYKKMISKGILFQGNIETLYGKYGRSVKLKLENMLKKHMIHFMGSDIHKSYDITYERNIKEKLEHLLNDEIMVNDLINKNIDKVIKNKEVKPYPIIENKKIKIFNK